MRGLSLLYKSPSSRYDWLYIRRTLGWGRLVRKEAQEQHQRNYFSGAYPDYVRRIHRAGRHAYIVELAIFVGFSALAMV